MLFLIVKQVPRPNKYGEIPEGTETVVLGYHGVNNYVMKKVVFDKSFAKARPTSTASWFLAASELIEIVDIHAPLTFE